ncbi:MAG TPA: methyltransferase domain-containing protein [Thermoanaerobaculia bacterium]|nr:methyltransferase domain-containing protein [Thermoanaerobaculia bacterium]
MDRQSLAIQYGTSANLAARIALHQRCSTNAYGLQRWVFDRLQLAPGQRVLEIACGTGSLWRENLDRIPEGLSLVLSDFAISMIETTRGVVVSARFVNCALPSLPFADESFDLVIANHMLYHVAERQKGLGEIRRVLRGGGTFFASTNGIDHLREIKDLMVSFGIEGSDVSSSFTLENGLEQLAPVFGDVQRDDYVDSLRVTDPEMLLGYVASMNARAAEVVGAREGEMRAVIEQRIARDGAFQVMKATGAFIARK